ncbi:hypothetical protein G4H72_11220 [Rhodococcus triatomae]|nr:hypothetical protein G4H72_11220 [Rhodococcus triatomae]
MPPPRPRQRRRQRPRPWPVPRPSGHSCSAPAPPTPPRSPPRPPVSALPRNKPKPHSRRGVNSSDPHAHYRTRGTPATTTPSPRRTPPLAAKYPNGVYITPQGFPDFSPYAVATVRLDQIGPTRPGDFARANAQAGIPRTPRGWVWHHVEDAHTLHLIPRDLHIEVSHHGGWSRMINVLMKGTT